MRQSQRRLQRLEALCRTHIVRPQLLAVLAQCQSLVTEALGQHGFSTTVRQAIADAPTTSRTRASSICRFW